MCASGCASVNQNWKWNTNIYPQLIRLFLFLVLLQIHRSPGTRLQPYTKHVKIKVNFISFLTVVPIVDKLNLLAGILQYASKRPKSKFTQPVYQVPKLSEPITIYGLPPLGIAERLPSCMQSEMGSWYLCVAGAFSKNKEISRIAYRICTIIFHRTTFHQSPRAVEDHHHHH